MTDGFKFSLFHRCLISIGEDVVDGVIVEDLFTVKTLDDVARCFAGAEAVDPDFLHVLLVCTIHGGGKGSRVNGEFDLILILFGQFLFGKTHRV